MVFDEEGWAYSGSEDGYISVWGDSAQCVKQIKAHEDKKTVTALATSQGKLISTATDGKVCIISAQGGNFTLDKFIDLKARVQFVDFKDGNLLIGLKSGTLRQYSDVLTSDEPAAKDLNVGHTDGETWGLEIIEGGKKFITCGDDNKIHVYDPTTKTLADRYTVSDSKEAPDAATNTKIADKLKARRAHKVSYTASTTSSYPYHQQARTLGFSAKRQHLVVGTNDGRISVRDFSKKELPEVAHFNVAEWCEDIKYSPCEKYLACASHDDAVHVYEV